MSRNWDHILKDDWASDADFFYYQGEIQRAPANQLIAQIKDAQKPGCKRKSAKLFLTTLGGDPDDAYRIAKAFQTNYEDFTVYVLGTCKSAGTLIVLGAKTIVMTEYGELGPLDIQLSKQDDIVRRNSGMNFVTALKLITDESFVAFQRYFIDLIAQSSGTITTQTASEIANSLVIGLYGKLMEQLDPVQIAEVTRSMSIANKYGSLLCGNTELVETLVSSYPSHTYVIDFHQAVTLFEGTIRVRKPDQNEMELCECFQSLTQQHSQKNTVSHLNKLEAPQQAEPHGDPNELKPEAEKSNDHPRKQNATSANGQHNTTDEEGGGKGSAGAGV